MTTAPVVVSLFDYTGLAVAPWARAGFLCLCVDRQHQYGLLEQTIPESGVVYVRADLSPGSPDWTVLETFCKDRTISMTIGFPPCDDLAASGAAHWERKRKQDPEFQIKACNMARGVEKFANRLGVRYVIENPAGALARLWRKSDFRVSPNSYGGYLPEDDAHPLYPAYIPSRDAYSKLTCLWTSNEIKLPPERPVDPIMVTTSSGKRGSPQWAKLGGKSLKTKNIRSATPRGLFEALFIANVENE